jgi:hypothetical protein
LRRAGFADVREEVIESFFREEEPGCDVEEAGGGEYG